MLYFYFSNKANALQKSTTLYKNICLSLACSTRRTRLSIREGLFSAPGESRNLVVQLTGFLSIGLDVLNPFSWLVPAPDYLVK